MSDNILIGKNRKTGKWEILVDPGENYDAHLREYTKQSATFPVNDVFSHVRFGRLQNTSSPKSFVTTEENKALRDKVKDFNQSIANAGEAAKARQSEINAAKQKALDDRRAEELAAKSKIVDGIRKSSGQSTNPAVVKSVGDAK